MDFIHYDLGPVLWIALVLTCFSMALDSLFLFLQLDIDIKGFPLILIKMAHLLQPILFNKIILIIIYSIIFNSR